MFSNDDILQIEQNGISMSTISEQITKFKSGFPFAKLSAAATLGNGVVLFSDEEVDFFVNYYKEKFVNREVTKFVPASGAATRMFKSLFEYRSLLKNDYNKAIELLETEKYIDVKDFFENIERFAFYKTLKSVVLDKKLDIDVLISSKNYLPILDLILENEGLNYAALPKALLRFHRYIDRSRMALEEHLVEGAQYAIDHEGIVRIHFTVSPEHQEAFVEQLNNIVPHYEQAFDAKFQISFSVQKSSTDTIAVDLENNPFRESDGKLLFRPGGHGALIQNLNDILGDIIFIKNIDNIVPDHLRAATIRYKQLIGGCLIFVQEKISNYLKAIETKDYDVVLLNEIEDFCQDELYIELPKSIGSLNNSEKAELLFFILNRPIRVCGMVKNEGEPGGGPFWVEKDGINSLQIVESSQINLKDDRQLEIFKMATHFNPVDLVCSVKNYEGNNFNLLDFIDEETGFIAEKSKDGKVLKALELPGLWNGAMARWITIFVEVPIITFNPVKVINDLLRSQHQ